MIRLLYLAPESTEKNVAFDASRVRFGTDTACEVRLPDADSIAPLHGELTWNDGAWWAIALDAQKPLWVNGEQTLRAQIKGGERVQLGSANGPVITILEATPLKSLNDDHSASTTVMSVEDVRRLHLQKEAAAADAHDEETIVTDPQLPPIIIKPPAAAQPPDEKPLTTMGKALELLKKPSEEVHQWLARAQSDIQRARSQSSGESSGKTMAIVALALSGIKQTADGRTRRSKRMLKWVLVASAIVVTVLIGVIAMQQQQIAQLVNEKSAIDVQIQTVMAAMSAETDSERLAEMEGRLQQLMGTAADKLAQVTRASPKRAEEISEPTDELDRQIRELLRSFHADTYAVPPDFREQIKRYVTELKTSPTLRAAAMRRMKVWPQIKRALRRQELPTELGYIAFAESTFDPLAQNPKSGAAGMWQLMEEVARTCGLAVNAQIDERFDPGRSSVGAGCYLSKLLIEFGEESFMLVLASYNRGENGVRRALHRLATEPGGYRKRDFWHLYRLKYLPEETREYVPKVLAAAIVFENPAEYGLAPERPQTASK